MRVSSTAMCTKTCVQLLRICVQLLKDELFFSDDYLCHYEGTNAKIWNGKCVLPYSEVIKYFLALWKFPNYESIYAKANRLQVSNDLEYLKNYSCAKNNYPDITTLKPCNVS